MSTQSIPRKYTGLPAVVRADRETEIVLRPLYDHSRFAPGCSYRIHHIAMDYLPGADSGKETIVSTTGEGNLRFSLHFPGEQEHVVRIETEEEKKIVASLRVYSLRRDLYDRRPYKGDIHCHSNRSDGTEDPAYVAAAARREGLDFFALTDHSCYPASLEAISAFRDAAVDLRIYPGEEIHPPGNPIHMLNVGGGASVTDLIRENTGGYRSEVEAVRKGLPELPDGVDPLQYASCLWCFEKIRGTGGLAVFCHPYWYWNDHFAAPGPLTNLLFAERPFDAVEVVTSLNSSHTRTNMMENTFHTARFYEEQARDGSLHPIGVTDAHRVEGAEDFGRCFTVVFASSPEREDVLDGIRSGFSVAVENLPGLGARPHGAFRLVKFTHFLLREVFPEHDELCREEGHRMLEYIHRDGSRDAEALSRLSGRTAALLERLRG